MGGHLIMQDIQNKFLFFPIFSGKFLFLGGLSLHLNHLIA